MKKQLQHVGKCGGTYQAEYTDSGTPYLVCQICQHKLEDWVKWEAEYKNHWQDDGKWTSKRDAIVCLLGYFAHLYQQHYGTPLAFSLNDRGLFMGSEAHQIRKLLKSCGSDAQLAREYLDWVFETKVRLRKRKITSLGFLNTEAVLNEFSLARKKKQLRTRSTVLPVGMLRWLEAKAPEVLRQTTLKDFGDLHMLLTHYRRGHLSGHADMTLFVQKLVSSGVIDGEFKINNWSE